MRSLKSNYKLRSSITPLEETFTDAEFQIVQLEAVTVREAIQAAINNLYERKIEPPAAFFEALETLKYVH